MKTLKAMKSLINLIVLVGIIYTMAFMVKYNILSEILDLNMYRYFRCLYI